jgi:hypothetical protein
MKRWDKESSREVEDPAVDAFLTEVVAVCKKHGMSIGHQDSHGAFQVYKRAHRKVLRWLMDAELAIW